MDRLKVGVIGTGQIGRVHAQQLATRIPDADLTAICDIDAAAAAACRAQCEVETLSVFDDYRRLLADAAIDAVVICTPGDTHAEVIEAACAASKQIFCEKPIDCDLAKADRALAAVERAGVKLQIGFNRRFDATFRRVREAIASATIGRLHMLQIISRDPLRDESEPLADLFLDTTIHDLDMARFLTGSEVTSVYAIGGTMAEPRGDDAPDTAVVVLRLANGVIASIHNSRHSVYYDQRVEAFGSDGSITAGNETLGQPRTGNREGALLTAPLPFFVERYLDSYVAEMAEFVRCVLQNDNPPVTGADGRMALVLALAAQRSYREGRAVAPAL